MTADLHSLVHNAGYDFLRELRHIVKEKEMGSISPYFREPLGVIFVCSGIEGYIYYSGEEQFSGWCGKQIYKLPIKEKINQVYSLIDLTPDFSESVFKDVIDISKFRNRIAHPTFQVTDRRGKSPVPDVFEEAAAKYAVERSYSIATSFRDRILSDFSLEDHWHTRGTNIETDIIRMKD